MMHLVVWFVALSISIGVIWWGVQMTLKDAEIAAIRERWEEMTRDDWSVSMINEDDIPVLLADREALLTNVADMKWRRGVEIRNSERAILELGAQLATARDEALEEAAKVADGFTCGGCGMDGKSSIAIRALKGRMP